MAAREDFFAAVTALPVIDTHEHLETEAERNARPLDVCHWFSHYASSDLVSAGLSPDDLAFCRDISNPLPERWAKIAPYWRFVKYTAYGRALRIAARDLFDVDDLSDETYELLSERLEASRKPGWYKHVMREKANIHKALFCGEKPGLDPELFVAVYQVDPVLWILSGEALAGLEKAFDCTLHSLDDYLHLLDTVIENAVNSGFCGFKLGMAYMRTLYFARRTRTEAEAAFNRLVQSGSDGVAPAEVRPLQDFLLHHFLERLSETGKPLQVHTGLQEGNGNFITNSKASHLANLLMEYPKVSFDLFHGSYPYIGELATLAKNFPNAYIDMCWLHVISPWVSRQALHEWL